MTEADEIKEGDKVVVYWENIGAIWGTVLHVPTATGDSWIIRQDGPKSMLTYVNGFGRMDRRKE